MNGGRQSGRGLWLPNKRLALLIAAALALVGAGAIAWRPLLRWHQLSRGRLALENRDPLQALQYFHAARQLAPDHPATHYQMARAYRQLGQLDRVHQCLKDAWRLGYDVAALQREQWLVLAQTGELKEAESPLVALLSDPQETRPVEISEALVRGYFANLRFGEAEQMLDAWQKDYPSDAEPHFLRGYFHEAFSRDDDALAEYERGLEKSPQRTDARLRLSGVLLRQQNLARTEKELLRCREEQPLDLQVQVAWAGYLCAAGRTEEARAVFEQVLIRAPNNPEALRRMGQIELAAKRPEDALRWLQPAVEKEPLDTTLRQALAQALQAAGRPDEAEPHLRYVEEAEQALRDLDAWLNDVLAQPQNAELRFKIGVAVLRYKSVTDGVRWLKTVLELDPKHAAAHRALADYYAQVGDLQAAQQHRARADKIDAGAQPAP